MSTLYKPGIGFELALRGADAAGLLIALVRHRLLCCSLRTLVILVMLRKAHVNGSRYVRWQRMPRLASTWGTARSDGDVLPQSIDIQLPSTQPFGKSSSVLCFADISYTHCAFRDGRSSGSEPFGHACIAVA